MSGMRTDTDVVITGAGPTGLMLACELRLAGVDVVVVDRLAGRTGESRAGGMHARTLEVLDQRGVLDRFLAAGVPRSIGHFSGLWLDFGRFDTRYTRSLMLLQSRIERLLEEWAGELGVRVRRSSEVTALRQDGDGVEVATGRARGRPLGTARPLPRGLRRRTQYGAQARRHRLPRHGGHPDRAAR